jgi:hypothetical protein
VTAPGAFLVVVVASLLAACGAAAIAPVPPAPSAASSTANATAGGSAMPSPSPTPVVLAATGTTRMQMPAGPLSFVAKNDGAADCRSGPDSRAVAGVTALELGELGSGTLRAMVGLPGPEDAGASAQFFIDGGDLPEGSYQPFWSGPVKVTTSKDVGASGTLTFSALPLEPDPGQVKAGETGPPADSGGWPATLTGTLSWTCGPWAPPVPGGPSAPPPSTAP